MQSLVRADVGRCCAHAAAADLHFRDVSSAYWALAAGLQLVTVFSHFPFVDVQDYVWYSDDHGKSYKMARTATGSSLLQMDEAELVELANGNVLANMRNKVAQPDPAPGHLRGVALSTDGGTSFGAVGTAWLLRTDSISDPSAAFRVRAAFNL